MKREDGKKAVKPKFDFMAWLEEKDGYDMKSIKKYKKVKQELDKIQDVLVKENKIKELVSVPIITDLDNYGRVFVSFSNAIKKPEY